MEVGPGASDRPIVPRPGWSQPPPASGNTSIAGRSARKTGFDRRQIASGAWAVSKATPPRDQQPAGRQQRPPSRDQRGHSCDRRDGQTTSAAASIVRVGLSPRRPALARKHIVMMIGPDRRTGRAELTVLDSIAPDRPITGPQCARSTRKQPSPYCSQPVTRRVPFTDADRRWPSQRHSSGCVSPGAVGLTFTSASGDGRRSTRGTSSPSAGCREVRATHVGGHALGSN